MAWGQYFEKRRKEVSLLQCLTMLSCCRGVLGVATVVVGKISLPSSHWHTAQQPIYVSTWLISLLVTDLGTPSPLAVKLYWLLCFAGFFFPHKLIWHGRTWNRVTLALTITGNCILDNSLRCKLCSHLRGFLWGAGGRSVHHPKSIAVGRVPVAAKVFGKGHEHLKAASEKWAWAHGSPQGAVQKRLQEERVLFDQSSQCIIH